jgi:hypothetical protein
MCVCTIGKSKKWWAARTASLNDLSSSVRSVNLVNIGNHKVQGSVSYAYFHVSTVLQSFIIILHHRPATQSEIAVDL